MSDLSLKMIEIVAKGLDDLKDRAMFVGGADADTMGAITGGSQKLIMVVCQSISERKC